MSNKEKPEAHVFRYKVFAGQIECISYFLNGSKLERGKILNNNPLVFDLINIVSH